MAADLAHAGAVACRGFASPRRGLTLIELLVAVAVTGIVLLCARALVDGLTATQLAVERTRRTVDASQVAERLLRGVVLNFQSANAESEMFAGTADSARFASWCPSAQGWLDRCLVRLRVDRGLVLQFTNFDERLPADRRAVALLFLQDATRGGTWTSEWSASRTAPMAIGVVRVGTVGRDTLILRIGARG